jgi:hypothetical protein
LVFAAFHQSHASAPAMRITNSQRKLFPERLERPNACFRTNRTPAFSTKALHFPRIKFSTGAASVANRIARDENLCLRRKKSIRLDASALSWHSSRSWTTD